MKKLYQKIKNWCNEIMIKPLKEIGSNLEAKEKQYLKAGLSLILLLGLISIIVLPWAFTRTFWSFVDYNKTGAIGDTINGIAGPFIALIAAILTFIAFYIQYKANIQQREQFLLTLKNQEKESTERDKTWKIERFENRFYELLKLHKANVEEMNIADNVRGRKCFVPMFYELRYCYRWTEKIVVQNQQLLNNKPKDFKLLAFVYRIFFFGIGSNSEKHFVHYFNDYELRLFGAIKGHLSEMQKSYSIWEREISNFRYFTFNIPLSQEPDDDSIDLFYLPYDGHVNRLGHYYRHLFQTANFIISQDFIDDSEKYSYIKTLRAQLSNFEQLMLYYNALAWFDDEWRDLFTTYRLIKNLPLPLADFDLKPEDYFREEIEKLRKKGIEMFELYE